MTAVSLTTGKPAKWPKYPYGTGTDRARFNCAWNGRMFELASFSEHVKHNVPEGLYLLIDTRNVAGGRSYFGYQTHLVRKSDVGISTRIG